MTFEEDGNIVFSQVKVLQFRLEKNSEYNHVHSIRIIIQ